MLTMNNNQESKSFDDMYNQNEDTFGHAYGELQGYFRSYPKKGTLLDLGCGQGRDALFLASIGYQVTAVDSSSIGIKQMMGRAKLREVKIDGIVNDVLNLRLEKKFDVILFDMLLHAFEESQQAELLKKYSNSIEKNGIICIVFPDDLRTDHFMSMLKSVSDDWKLLEEIRIRDVPRIEGEDNSFTFIMMVAQFSGKRKIAAH